MTEVESNAFDGVDELGTISKRVINDRPYVVAVETFRKRGRDYHSITVWVGSITGSDFALPEHPRKMFRTDYKLFSNDNVEAWRVDDRASLVSEKLNEAVCETENRSEDLQELQTQVEAALEANAEVHGGIDEQLKQ